MSVKSPPFSASNKQKKQYNPKGENHQQKKAYLQRYFKSKSLRNLLPFRETNYGLKKIKHMIWAHKAANSFKRKSDMLTTKSMIKQYQRNKLRLNRSLDNDQKAALQVLERYQKMNKKTMLVN